jgi:hypothetical protein
VKKVLEDAIDFSMKTIAASKGNSMYSSPMKSEKMEKDDDTKGKIDLQEIGAIEIMPNKEKLLNNKTLNDVQLDAIKARESLM